VNEHNSGTVFDIETLADKTVDLVIMHPTVWLDSYQVVVDGVQQAGAAAV